MSIPRYKPDFVKLYTYCYPAVQNEMYMREYIDDITGRFIRDDFPVDNKLHSVAWVLMHREQTVLHFPETYGNFKKVHITNPI